jgi:enoyl-CoA hydratase/carnithine racemase
VSHVPESSPTATPVIVITLNRPAKHNAFTGVMQQDLCKAYEMIDVDDRVKVVVLTGAGDRSFCAGADLDVGFPGGASKSGQPSANAHAGGERPVDHRDGYVTAQVW